MTAGWNEDLVLLALDELAAVGARDLMWSWLPLNQLGLVALNQGTYIAPKPFSEAGMSMLPSETIGPSKIAKRSFRFHSAQAVPSAAHRSDPVWP